MSFANAAHCISLDPYLPFKTFNNAGISLTLWHVSCYHPQSHNWWERRSLELGIAQMPALICKQTCVRLLVTGCLLVLSAIPARAVFLIDDFNIPTTPVAIVDVGGGGSASASHAADAYPTRLTTVTATAGVL